MMTAGTSQVRSVVLLAAWRSLRSAGATCASTGYASLADFNVKSSRPISLRRFITAGGKNQEAVQLDRLCSLIPFKYTAAILAGAARSITRFLKRCKGVYTSRGFPVHAIPKPHPAVRDVSTTSHVTVDTGKNLAQALVELRSQEMPLDNRHLGRSLQSPIPGRR